MSLKAPWQDAGSLKCQGQAKVQFVSTVSCWVRELLSLLTRCISVLALHWAMHAHNWSHQLFIWVTVVHMSSPIYRTWSLIFFTTLDQFFFKAFANLFYSNPNNPNKLRCKNSRRVLLHIYDGLIKTPHLLIHLYIFPWCFQKFTIFINSSLSELNWPKVLHVTPL